MLFSERYGYKQIDKAELHQGMPEYLKTRIWNVFRIHLSKISNERKQIARFLKNLWDKLFKEKIDILISNPFIFLWFPEKLIPLIGEKYIKLNWFEVYDFIEFVLKEFPDREKINALVNGLNEVLKEERAPYQITNCVVTPLTNEGEIKEIEKALNPPDKFDPVRHHLKKSLEKLSERKNPDYANSIKESILAVESLAQIITGKDKALSGLIQSLKNVHYNLREGFKELYNWTSKEGGIRHAKSGKTLEPGMVEARYMLVTVSAFVNYVIAKYSENEKGE